MTSSVSGGFGDRERECRKSVTGFYHHASYLRVSLEVSLVKRLDVALVRAWGSGLASWCDRVGEVGGAE